MSCNWDISFIHSSKTIITLPATPKIQGNLTTQLNVIRSWNFDFLFVILFVPDGAVEKALLSPASVAQEYARKNDYQNGWVITTTHNFLHDFRNQDVTSQVKKL